MDLIRKSYSLTEKWIPHSASSPFDLVFLSPLWYLLQMRHEVIAGRPTRWGGQIIGSWTGSGSWKYIFGESTVSVDT